MARAMGTNNTNTQKPINSEDENRIITKISLVGIVGNIFLSAFKFFAGILGDSAAMVSDAVHSLSDVFATIIALIGVKAGRRAPDEGHPYGHDRFESVASLVLGLILMVTAFGIGWAALQQILSGNPSELEVPKMIALIAAVVSIAVKEGMFWYVRHYAKLIGSDAFMADAWHHRSDAISSIGALIGIGGAMLGFPIMDNLASIAICLMILKVAFDIIREALDKMVDSSCPKEFEDELRALVERDAGVVRIDSLTTRQFGNKVYVDLEIAADGDKTLHETHETAERVEHDLEQKFPQIKHVMVHVNPA